MKVRLDRGPTLRPIVRCDPQHRVATLVRTRSAVPAPTEAARGQLGVTCPAQSRAAHPLQGLDRG